MRTNPRTPPRHDASGLIELCAGDARVVIDTERGGRLSSWSVGGRELLVGPPDDDDRSIRWGCYLMAPWAGRLADGRFDWAGRTVQLARTHGRHAIHGLLWDRAWTVETAGRDAAMLSIDLADAGWPMGGRVRHRVALFPDRLALEAVVEADEPMPAAAGWHPWFQATPAVRVRVDAGGTLATDRMLPTGQIEPLAGQTDLRAGPALRRRRLDHAYVDARPPAVIAWPDLELSIEFAPAPATVVVHTPPGRLCVEPQTAWPNALALPDPDEQRAGVRRLRPGESLVATATMRWRAAAPD
jgi:aldose 1-epimerase